MKNWFGSGWKTKLGVVLKIVWQFVKPGIDPSWHDPIEQTIDGLIIVGVAHKIEKSATK